MRSLKLAHDFVAISDFKARAPELLRRTAASGSPLVVTQNGKPAGVVLSPEAFDELTERARFVDSIERGLADVDAGRVISDAALTKRLARKFKSLRR